MISRYRKAFSRDFDNALAQYRTLLEQNDASAEVHNNLGLLYQDHGDNVESVKQFQRWGKLASHELQQGYIPMDRLEILRLDNDPNFSENGILRLNMGGGK